MTSSFNDNNKGISEDKTNILKEIERFSFSSNDENFGILMNQYDKEFNKFNQKNEKLLDKSAALNTIKAYQENLKNSNLQIEDLKQKNLKLIQLLDNERSKNLETTSIQSKNLNDTEKYLRNEIYLLRVENKALKQENLNMKNEINYLKYTLELAENDKLRHIEQNLIEIESIKSQYENIQFKYDNLIEENMKLAKSNDLFSVDLVNKKSNLKEVLESSIKIRNDLQIQVDKLSKENQEIKLKYEGKEIELNNSIEGLKSLVRSLEKQKKEIIKEYEKKISEIRNELIGIQEKNLKRFILGQKTIPKATKSNKSLKMVQSQQSISINPKNDSSRLEGSQINFMKRENSKKHVYLILKRQIRLIHFLSLHQIMEIKIS